jgi:hypothetical protein
MILLIRPPRQTPRISQAAIKSFFCLFDKHCWEKLPDVKELLQLPDVQAIISQHWDGNIPDIFLSALGEV